MFSRFGQPGAGISGEGIAEALRESREFGVQNIPAIAKRYSEELSLKEEFLREYLTENVHYYMDEACVEGLQLFYRNGGACRRNQVREVAGVLMRDVRTILQSASGGDSRNSG